MSASLGDTHQTTFRAAPGTFVDAYNTAVTFAGDSSQATRTIGKRGAPASAVTFDFADLPPALTGAEVDSTSPKRPKVTWTGNMGSMKGGIVYATWFDPIREGSTHWSIVVPVNSAATGSVTAPALPAELDDALPSADGGQNTWRSVPEVTFVDSDLVLDYAVWRKVQGIIVPSTSSPEEAVLPQNGTFKMSRWRGYAD